MALDAMTGLIPVVITAGIVQKVTESSFPSEGRGRRRNGPMEGEQERYEPKEKRMRYGHNKATKKAYKKGKSARKALGKTPSYGKISGTQPSGLTSMMKAEGRKVMSSVAYEGHKLGSGTLGSLPGVGKVTSGKISDIGIGGNRIFDAAKRGMGRNGIRSNY